MNPDHPYSMFVKYPDGSNMTVPELDAEAAIMFAQQQLLSGRWASAELTDERGELVWAGSRKSSVAPPN